VNNGLAFAMPLTTAFWAALAAAFPLDGGALVLGLTLGLAGISNAILLQVLCRGEGGSAERPATTSGDASV
jgi:hypothetical protein